MSEKMTDLRPSLFDGDDATAGRVDRASWRIVNARLEPAALSHVDQHDDPGSGDPS